MSRDLAKRYIWFADTIRRFGRISRARIDRCWAQTEWGDGRGMPRRTFANYRAGAEQLLGIEIKCDPATYEYYIAEETGVSCGSPSVSEWLMNSMAVSEVISNSRDIAGKIFVEDVPSARDHLAPVTDALRRQLPVRFDYHSYHRTTTARDIVLDPYFIKLFRQRWYVVGLNRREGRIKTYALDRISGLTLGTEPFETPADFDAAEYMSPCFGIVFGDGAVPKDVVLRTDALQAKYLRALPLHHSQTEYVHDTMSVFHYRMRVTQDLVEHILSMGPKVVVMQPPELRNMVRNQLRSALAAYTDSEQGTDDASAIHSHELHSDIITQ